MNETCNCCSGVQGVTPLSIANRPGLDALQYRIGTHGSFLETMIARLSSLALEVPVLNAFDAQGQQITETLYPLQQLTTRAASDPAIAFLDAWALIADVLTFYQERIANEGYLHTATERRSIIELARLVGYKLRPGVAASVYLAYTLEKDHNVVILPGNRAQSVPDPGEKAQPFETGEKLEARFAWNTLKPRQTKPQLINAQTLAITDPVIYLQGTATNVQRGDPLLFLMAGNELVLRVKDAKKQSVAKRTKITLDSGSKAGTRVGRSHLSSTPLATIVNQLALPPSLQPPNTQRLERAVTQTFAAQSDIHLQMLSNLVPQLQNTLYSAVANASPQPVVPDDITSVQAFRVQAAPFGYNAPLQVDEHGATLIPLQDWPLVGSAGIRVQITPPPIIMLEAGGGAPPAPALFGGKCPLDYQIGIRLEDGKEQLSVTQEVAESKTVNIALADQNVEIVFTVDQNQLLTNASFNFQGFDQVIDITRDANDWDVKVGGVTFQHVASLTKDINAGEVTISLDTSFSISLSMVANRNVLPLDAQYDKIIPLSWVSVERPDRAIIAQVKEVQVVFPIAYNISARVTQLILDRPWLTGAEKLLTEIRGIVVYAQSEELSLAEVPIEEDIANAPSAASNAQLLTRIATGAISTTDNGTDTIELDQLYDGLKAGQRLIVSGERTDVLGADGQAIRGIFDGELVMLKAVKQDVFRDPSTNTPLPGDTPHTFLFLANKLRFTYRRDNLVIFANVVQATHGETRNEVLGSGDGSQELQAFTLHQSPLTYVSANTPAGVASTLQVRANGLLWHEADSLPELQATTRGYITETDDTGKTTVTFGNGTFGARLPTGIENITATYRSGIGTAGNVRAGQITLLSTKPLGVKGVVNPLQASGGADPESRDQARRNVPLAALALDRLVAVEDYEHFTRTFGGIGKASAAPLTDGRRQLVHVTIVGADNAPILKTSDLYRNLFSALRKFGDPNEPLIVAVAEVLFLVISAKVHLLPDFLFEIVEPKIRSALLSTFSFDNRTLGQSVFRSEVISTIQNVFGVDYVELEVMEAVGQAIIVQASDAESSGQADTSEADDANAEDATEDEGESDDVEKAEEFLEALGLTGVQDVLVRLARPDKNNPLASGGVAPAQLAFLSPDVPDTLILAELP